jgi:hypothetical protein
MSVSRQTDKPHPRGQCKPESTAGPDRTGPPRRAAQSRAPMEMLISPADALHDSSPK